MPEAFISRYLRVLRHGLIWLAALLALAWLLALLVYLRSSDAYLVSAVTTAKEDEAGGFNLGSIAGLAALATGGQRPAYGEFTYLIDSKSSLRRVLPPIEREHPKFIAHLSQMSAVERALLGIEQAARSLFGKPLKEIDRTDRLIRILQDQVDVKKTTEGFSEIRFVTQNPAAGVALISALIAAADDVPRQRARQEYRNRISTYRMLLDQETRPSERTVLTALIGREYGVYVQAQSGRSFSFEFVDPPGNPQRVYARSLLSLLILATVGAVFLYLGALFMPAWFRGR